MSSDDSNTSATDIITYIGVPLAVLGVLPILYNTFATLVSLSRIKRMLRHSRLTALTRSDVVNRVIEIELPRYAVQPLDRYMHRDEYWSLSHSPSSIPGGTWTTFNWRTNAIGIKTQRVEYADQVRQPQVEVQFGELVAYLLDLGAVPDPQGWKLLRSTGLWTPVGCSLMVAPDGLGAGEKALMVAPLDDSDGNLSLAAKWSSEWTTRDHSHLPPYWVKLPPPQAGKIEEESKEAGNSAIQTPLLGEDAKNKKETDVRGSVDTVELEGKANARRAITCEVSAEGVTAAMSHDADISHGEAEEIPLYIEHLKPRSDRLDGQWFASAVTAFGKTSQTVLWKYSIPQDILAFAKRDSVPCGILVLLEMVDESETPEWATKYDDSGRDLDRIVRQAHERTEAIRAESRMSESERQEATRKRSEREGREMLQDLRDKDRLRRERRENRMLEALQSPKWNNQLVAEHALNFLKRQKQVRLDAALREEAGYMLHRMVLDGKYATDICNMLDSWRAWADNAGMRRADYADLQEKVVLFAQAALIVALIREASSTLQGTLATDLQECINIWRKVRLG